MSLFTLPLDFLSMVAIQPGYSYASWEFKCILRSIRFVFDARQGDLVIEVAMNAGQACLQSWFPSGFFLQLQLVLQ